MEQRPRGLNALCSAYGLLVAQGVLEREDAVVAVQQACAEAGNADAVRIGSALMTTCALTLNEAALRWESVRGRTEWAIRKSVAGLLSEWAAPEAILAGAHAINEAALNRKNPRHLGPLMSREVLGIVNEEIAWWMKRQPARRRRRAR